MRLRPHTNIWVCPFCKGQMEQPRQIERSYADPVHQHQSDQGIAELIGLHMIHEHQGFTRTQIPARDELPFLDDD